MNATRRISEGADALVVHPVASYDGRARELIKELKYDGRLEHARYLGHLLFQRLDRRWESHEFDRVIPNPTDRHRGVRHTELLIDSMAAADKGRRWVFDDPAHPCLVKTRPTVSAHAQDLERRRDVAEAVERALVVSRPELVAGRRLLVVDDVVTTGAQLQAVARILRNHGAVDVQGLVVASVTPPAVAGPVERLDPRSERALGRLYDLAHRAPRIDGLTL